MRWLVELLLVALRAIPASIMVTAVYPGWPWLVQLFERGGTSPTSSRVFATVAMVLIIDRAWGMMMTIIELQRRCSGVGSNELDPTPTGLEVDSPRFEEFVISGTTDERRN